MVTLKTCFRDMHTRRVYISALIFNLLLVINVHVRKIKNFAGVLIGNSEKRKFIVLTKKDNWVRWIFNNASLRITA